MLDQIDSSRESIDRNTRTKKITELYTEGKITASQRKMLEEKISRYYKAVSDTTSIENHDSVPAEEYNKSVPARKSATGTIMPPTAKQESNPNTNLENK